MTQKKDKEPETSGDEFDRRALMARALGAVLLGGMAMNSASGGAHKAAGTPVTYPPCDPKLLAELDAVLKRTEEIWLAQEWWRLPD